MPVTLDDIRAAAKTIAGNVRRTPSRPAAALSAATGADIVLKFENLQRTASFKERGAVNKLASLSEAERKAGVIAMSAGNHAQAVAYHAARLGIPATIVMPGFTPFVKVRQTREHGAQIVLEGETLAESEEVALKIAREKGLTVIHPYDDDLIIAGAGTVGLELMEDHPDLDVLLVPVGGGGIISGIATAAKALKPGIEIIGVEAAAYPSLYAALRGETPRWGGATIAEGIAVKNVGARTLEICKRLLDDVLVVEEAEIERAITMLLSKEKTVVEGAGAAGLAAVLTQPYRFAGRKVGIVLCGGNIDLRLLATVILRDMMREGRIVRISVDSPDAPGQLARITRIVADNGGSVLEVSHSRLMLDMTAKNTNIDLLIETRDASQAQDIIVQLRNEGFTLRRI